MVNITTPDQPKVNLSLPEKLPNSNGINDTS